MNHNFIHLPIVLYLTLLSSLVYAEGFIAGTLVKTATGYTTIENILPGDHVLCFDDQRRLVERPVIFIAKKQIDRYICLMVNNEVICACCDQKLLSVVNNEWVIVQKLREHDLLMAAETNYALTSIEMKNESVDVYVLSVAEYHNFFVSKVDLSAHNLFPVILLGLSCAFGGGLEFAGISLGLAGLGTYLGYQWHKKNKKHDIVAQSVLISGSLMPEGPDDEEEKKRKRNKNREDYKSLNNKEANELAKDLGYRRAKDNPCGDTRNEQVFFNGKNYISPDGTGHKGGIWKVPCYIP